MKRNSEVTGNGILEEIPPSEVVATARRRHCTAEYKQRILTELDSCEHGQIGAVLRREGIYSSTITQWRTQQPQGLEQRKRGRKASEDTQLRKQRAQLQRQNERLEGKLRQAEKIIAVQKKVSEILGALLPDDQESMSK